MSTFNEYSKVAAELADIDVGMLVLNAGALTISKFSILSPEELESQINLNALHVVYLAKALMPQILSRQKKTALIVTSSGLGTYPFPMVLPYSMSKSFSSFLA
jgi:short-subunit dehydrogenase